MKNFWPLISLVSILLIHLLGHYDPVNSLILPPIVLGISAWLILEYVKWNHYFKILIIFILVFINDLLHRIAGGGIFDLEGNWWILMFSGGALFTILILIINDGITKKIVKKMLISLIVPTILTSLYFIFFGTLGVIWEKLPTKSIEESRIRNLLVSELKFSEKDIITNSDTLHIKDGWVENILKVEDKGFKYDSTLLKSLKVIIKVEGRFDRTCHNDSVKYKIDLPNYSQHLLCSTIYFTIDSLIDTISIIFYYANDEKEIIKIKTIANKS